MSSGLSAALAEKAIKKIPSTFLNLGEFDGDGLVVQVISRPARDKVGKLAEAGGCAGQDSGGLSIEDPEAVVNGAIEAGSIV